ncbi:hypothetical protein LR48_Vigan03g199200 [Vigna angularis]|uniref:Uncharacterized protein n=1 Tax=Phaseolus angularis TaxID=3914 RepID=A0A0L9U741_PHAAN|nr:hypothetical protein LR48_Vigan03g199200 [Vigna angularis]
MILYAVARHFVGRMILYAIARHFVGRLILYAVARHFVGRARIGKWLMDNETIWMRCWRMIVITTLSCKCTENGVPSFSRQEDTQLQVQNALNRTRVPGQQRSRSGAPFLAPGRKTLWKVIQIPRKWNQTTPTEFCTLQKLAPGRPLQELMTTPGPRKSNFLTIRKKSGASSSTARPTSVPKVPRPPPAGSSAGRVPPTDKAGGSGVKVSGSSLPPKLAAVQVGPTSGAAMTSADPTRKRKDPTADRTFALAWYLRNFADRPGVAEVRAELDREKKNAASLQVTLEEMVLNQDEYDKRIEQLEADLEKAKRESAEGLAAARIEQERLAEENRQKIDLLEAEVTRVKEAESCRAKANEELTLEVAKAKEQIAELESTILFEHEEGFNKALRQVTLLAGVQDPFALGVDIEKDVFNGVLVDLNAAEENEPTAEAAGGGKN